VQNEMSFAPNCPNPEKTNLGNPLSEILNERESHFVPINVLRPLQGVFYALVTAVSFSF